MHAAFHTVRRLGAIRMRRCRTQVLRTSDTTSPLLHTKHPPHLTLLYVHKYWQSYCCSLRPARYNGQTGSWCDCLNDITASGCIPPNYSHAFYWSNLRLRRFECKGGLRASEDASLQPKAHEEARLLTVPRRDALRPRHHR